MPAKANKPRRVVIVGGGIVGASVAYALVQLQRQADAKKVPGQRVQVTLIEAGCQLGTNSGAADGCFAAASCDGTALEQLARHGFSLHEEWAAALGAHPAPTRNPCGAPYGVYLRRGRSRGPPQTPVRQARGSGGQRFRR